MEKINFFRYEIIIDSSLVELNKSYDFKTDTQLLR